MDWFLYDNGLRHERVKYFFDDILHILNLRQTGLRQIIAR